MQEGPNRFISCRAAIKQLLARQKLSRWIKNLWRSYRDKFQKVSMDQKCNKICPEKKSKGLDRYLSVEICLEVVMLDKKKKIKERKNTQKWMQSSKLLNQRSKQHVKLSKTSLNKKMQSIHRSKTHTHTHTHTKQL